MYQLLMILCGILFGGLVGGLVYHKHLAKVAKRQATKWARIRATAAWLRQNIHLPQRLLRRKERQVARVAKWARQAEEAAANKKRQAEEEARKRVLGKQVKRVLDPYLALDAEVREEERKTGKKIPVYPLTSDKGLAHR